MANPDYVWCIQTALVATGVFFMCLAVFPFSVFDMIRAESLAIPGSLGAFAVGIAMIIEAETVDPKFRAVWWTGMGVFFLVASLSVLIYSGFYYVEFQRRIEQHNHATKRHLR